MLPRPFAATAVVGVRQEIGILPDILEGFQDDIPVVVTIEAEPFFVPLRLKRNMAHVSVSIGNHRLGACTGHNKLLLFYGRAVDVVVAPLVVDAPGAGEIARELDLCDTLNGGIQVLGSAVSVDVGKLVRRFDGVVVPGAGSSRVVYGRD